MASNLVQSVNESINLANKEQQLHCCKRCGFDQTQEVVKVAPEILQSYFRAALAQTAFSHTYSLFNGMLSATFEEPSGELLRLQELAALHRTKNEETTISDAMDFAIVPTLACVTSTDEDGATKVIYNASVERRAELLKQFTIPDELKNMPMIMLQALRNTYAEFSQLCSRLIGEAQDANFWKGVGRN